MIEYLKEFNTFLCSHYTHTNSSLSQLRRNTPALENSKTESDARKPKDSLATRNDSLQIESEYEKLNVIGTYNITRWN